MPEFDKPSEEFGLEGHSFFDAIDHDDDLIAVIRGQIYVEHKLNTLLLMVTPGVDPYLLKLSFAQKIDIARTSGLIGPELKRAMMWLAELRNRFAHRPTAISVEDAATAKARSSEDGSRYIDDMIDYYKRDSNDSRSIVRFAIVHVFTEIRYAIEDLELGKTSSN
jgi:hypothetical protein